YHEVVDRSACIYAGIAVSASFGAACFSKIFDQAARSLEPPAGVSGHQPGDRTADVSARSTCGEVAVAKAAVSLLAVVVNPTRRFKSYPSPPKFFVPSRSSLILRLWQGRSFVIHA